MLALILSLAVANFAVMTSTKSRNSNDNVIIGVTQVISKIHIHFDETIRLDLGIVCDWCQRLYTTAELNSVRSSWTNRQSLELHALTLLLGLSSLSCVFLDSVQELVPRS